MRHAAQKRTIRHSPIKPVTLLKNNQHSPVQISKALILPKIKKIIR